MTTPVNDPLLQCLLALAKYHGNGTTAEALTSGLPLQEGRLTPSLFGRAASRTGLASKVLHQNLPDIEPSLLPAILLLDDERACILHSWDPTTGEARVVYPELNEAVVNTSIEDLQQRHQISNLTGLC